MANISKKQQRKIAKSTSLSYKRSIAADKRDLLEKPATPGDRKHDKNLVKRIDAPYKLQGRLDKLSRNGQFKEAANIRANEDAKGDVRINTMISSTKLAKASAKADNPGPKSGFLSKAKNR